MSLAHLVYHSEICIEAFGDGRPVADELQSMLQRAQRSNQEISVTGILLYSAGHFLQILEGHPLVLRRLYKKIESDPRHKNVRQLAYLSSESRMFNRWFMGMLNLDERQDIDPALFDEFQETAKYALDDETAKKSVFSLLREFKELLEYTPEKC